MAACEKRPGESEDCARCATLYRPYAVRNLSDQAGKAADQIQERNHRQSRTDLNARSDLLVHGVLLLSNAMKYRICVLGYCEECVIFRLMSVGGCGRFRLRAPHEHLDAPRPRIVYRCTRPEPSPAMSCRTSATVERLTSSSIECLRQLAAAAYSMTSCDLNPCPSA